MSCLLSIGRQATRDNGQCSAAERQCDAASNVSRVTG